MTYRQDPSNTTNLGANGWENNGNDRITPHFQEPQNWSRTTGCSLVLYPGHSFLGGLTPLQGLQDVIEDSACFRGFFSFRWFIEYNYNSFQLIRYLGTSHDVNVRRKVYRWWVRFLPSVQNFWPCVKVSLTL